jgi:hypothetical protein
MARILNTYECPHCSEPLISSKRPDKCPNPKCGYDFGEAINEYKYPVTLREQLERMLTKAAHHDAVIGMPIVKANFMMNDALNIIETIAAKNVKTSDIRNLITMAIRIGDIATKYHEYLEAGGKHVPSLFIKEGDTGDVQKTTDGKGSS